MSDEKRLSAQMKAKWIAALRSGRFIQGDGALVNSDDCFCCLGVLACAVLGMPEEDLHDKEHLTDISRDDVLGPWSPDHCIPYKKGDPKTWVTLQRQLAGRNDSGKSFAEIADWIEVNL